jgi:hypothetical protein
VIADTASSGDTCIVELNRQRDALLQARGIDPMEYPLRRLRSPCHILDLVLKAATAETLYPRVHELLASLRDLFKPRAGALCRELQVASPSAAPSSCAQSLTEHMQKCFSRNFERNGPKLFSSATAIWTSLIAPLVWIDRDMVPFQQWLAGVARILGQMADGTRYGSARQTLSTYFSPDLSSWTPTLSQ